MIEYSVAFGELSDDLVNIIATYLDATAYLLLNSLYPNFFTLQKLKQQLLSRFELLDLVLVLKRYEESLNFKEKHFPPEVTKSKDIQVTLTWIYDMLDFHKSEEGALEEITGWLNC